ncbi:MAG: PD-(D/E)XK nuclease family protein [Proteobacteria bacterium]|nr:PD-(D/E)XK nuclease family protein [Pseudomonadota bacterium]
MPIYSYSRLGSFAQCPLKYRYAYIDGLDRMRSSIEAFMGNRFHEVMERLYERAPQSCPSADDLKGLFLRLWDEKWSDRVVCPNPERTPEGMKALGLRAIDDYWRRYRPFDQGRVTGLERELHVDLDGTGRYRLRCILDRIMSLGDGSFEIHDYKTSAFPPVQKKLDEDEQLALYEIALRQNWPDARSVELVWHYVACDMEMRSQRTQGQLDELRAKTRERIDEVERAAEFPPRESELCGWCDYQPICPLFAHMFRARQLPLEEYATDDAIGLVNRCASLDAERKELGERMKQVEAELERLKAKAAEKGALEKVTRLFGDTHFLTIKDDFRISYPKKEEISRDRFEHAMHALGLWDKVADINWGSFKALAKSSGWNSGGGVPDELSPFVKVEPVKQVRLSRRKDLDDELISL